jgi:hypothetical protein
MDIRSSQYVITYGPGAIVETRAGPGVMMRADQDIFKLGNLSPKDPQYEIYDLRATQLLQGISGHGECRIFSMPVKEQGGSSGREKYIHRLKQFPTWKLCTNKSDHESLQNSAEDVLFQGYKCPVCSVSGNAIRFIQACRNGHMSDIWWSKLISNHDNCAGKWYWSISEGQ